MSSPSVRLFSGDDIEPALELCRSSGWNQLHADWLRLIAYEPRGCFIAEVDGQLVGTVTTTRYGTELAWIGMMLVHESFRRRGVGTALMRTSLDYLWGEGVQCVKLDATPAGQPVYERLGFQPEGEFHRWSRDEDKPNVSCEKEPPVSLTETHLELDRLAFGVDRSNWLERLASDSSVCLGPCGYGMRRPGHLANYVGPLVAESPDEASKIVAELLGPVTGETFWDVPPENDSATELAQSNGFNPVRQLTRMWTGSKRISPMMENQYALSDPGTG